MHRIDTATATPDNRFTEGDPTIPVAATVVSADWLNAVQEELAAVITGAGLELDKVDNAQLRQAISQAITAAKPGLATTTAPGLVQIGDGLAITAQGLLSVLVATLGQNGIMRPDGTTCTVVGGVLSVLQQADEHMGEWRTSWIGVPRPWRSTALPPSHCWANGDFVAFADWPELKAVYEAGGFEGLLLDWDADGETQAANLGQWRPDAAEPTGLYTPNLTGQFLRAWEVGKDTDAGAWNKPGVPEITGELLPGGGSRVSPSAFSKASGAVSMVGTGSGYTYGESNSGSYALYKFVFSASRSNPIYGASPTVMPPSINIPFVIYLGNPSKEDA